MPEVSIVAPVLDEEANIAPFYEAVRSAMDRAATTWELILVDDGSTDGSCEVARIIVARDPRVRLLVLSRNFGHQAALSAGLAYASGAAAVTLDADLQHPPELIPELVARWRQGYDVVHAVRASSAAGLAKRLTSALYYRLMGALSNVRLQPGSADFRLLSRAALDALQAMPERQRFLRAMVRWIGFPQCSVAYSAPPRRAGRSKFSLVRMLALALDGITSFSAVPLRLAPALGLFSVAVAFLYGAYAVFMKVFEHATSPGWTSLFVIVVFLGGTQLISLGIIGEYLARTFTECKARPLYIVRAAVGFDGGRRRPARVVAFPRRRPALDR